MKDLNKLCEEITSEMIKGFAWNPDRPVVAIYGSARLPENSVAYQEAYKLSKMLGNNKWTVLTGGGPGIMEAGNKGAFEVGAESVGLNIHLPHEQASNGLQTKELHFNHFTSRKAVFVRRTDIFVAFEGGFGTLDEIFDTVTQVQTGKRSKTKIVLVGKEFWGGLIQWIENTLLQRNLISDGDDKYFVLVDTAEEAFEEVNKIWKDMGYKPSEYIEMD